ncbi:hypothetical protein LK526_11665 [[Clostridium] innocuum]|uniref:hypothetical protein n=1 Tax=Bacillota TaxID=1239 RepID=UPI001C38E15D|nr:MULTISPECIES: hypothetical protein [Thomasclavelia]MBV4343111.1 hypothetical protein [Erysipelatoclostridium sp. DFI.2.3]MCC2792918.1 hypothetical protein [[Clostridium] innocuum]MCC2800887.1 hypothetical protein [[Clostridium] innocuum]MCC2807037.1 hypothetical protein [[Clostridium] innocuum]MCC2811260.1 hypothetical protein [[Clostridium] innocuum]
MAVITKSNKNIEITKNIEVDNVQVEQVKAVINTSNPENANLTHYISNQTLYKANRTEVRAAEAAAEDEIYVEQDAIITELAGGNKDAA